MPAPAVKAGPNKKHPLPVALWAMETDAFLFKERGAAAPPEKYGGVPGRNGGGQWKTTRIFSPDS